MKILRRFRSLFRKDKLEADMAEEMRLHLEMQTERNRAGGMTAEEAGYAAHREFGNVASLQEQARAERFGALAEQLGRDLVFAVRQWRKMPGLTLVMLATLMLGIGANSAIYSLVQGVVLRPLSIKDQASVVQIWEANPTRNVEFFSVSALNFFDWRERSRSFGPLVAVSMRGATLTGVGDPEQLAVSYVSEGYFSLLGMPLLLGRDFRPDEEQSGVNQVVVLSENFWRGRMDADRSVIGRSLILQGKPHTIVGVASRDPGLSGRGDLFVPLGVDLKNEERDNHALDVYGRLRPGVSREQAANELSAIAAHLAREYPVSNQGWGVRLMPLADALVAPSVRAALFTLLGAVALLLLNACANLSSLQLARAVSRDRELTIRAALGGSKGRIARQLLAENLLLSLLGGAAGVGLAHWLVTGWRTSSFAAALPRADEVGIDGGVVVFTFGVSVVVGTLTGLLPVWRANRLDLRAALNQGTRTAAGGRHRALRGLVLAQIALSFVLLAAAGVLLRSFQKLTQVDLGFTPAGVLTLKLAPGEDGQRFFTQLTERVGALPGVQSVGVGSGVPLESFNTSTDVQPARRAVEDSAMASGLPIKLQDSLGTLVDRSLWPYRAFASISGALTGLALLLATVGLYGVVSFGVNQRTREIGVRMALGATAERVTGFFVRQGMRLVAFGIGFGLLGGTAFAVLLSKVMPGADFAGPVAFRCVVFAVVTLLLSLVALFACWLPARRAAKVDPMIALRAE